MYLVKDYKFTLKRKIVRTIMSEDFRLVHGFNLNVSSVDGKPSIFLLSVFPENIVRLDQLEPSGANVTLKEPDGKIITLRVIQNVQVIKQFMRRCHELDDQAKRKSQKLKGKNE